MRYISFYLVLLFPACFSFCKKEKHTEQTTMPAKQELILDISYLIDTVSFQTNQLLYTSAANYPYSISQLAYYLSDISLIKQDSASLFLKQYQYCDAAVPGTNQLSFTDIPAGNYIGLRFNIGLDPSQNTSNYLAPGPENINMQWPEPMGGGYHFLKLEGHFRDNSKTYGYAMHLGTNASLVKVNILKQISVEAGASTSIHLRMNINEWFKNPYTYDFVSDGNYSMGDPRAMKKLCENGKDVFTLY